MIRSSNSSLLRRTVVLVLGALAASVAFSTLAFVIAGRNAAFNEEVNNIFDQTGKAAVLVEEFGRSDSEQLSFFLENISEITGTRFRLTKTNGDMISPLFSLDESDLYYTEKAKEVLVYDPEEKYSLKIIEEDGPMHNVMLTRFNITLDDGDFCLLSISEIDEMSDVISQYVNILLLSTLAAALTMIVPVVLVVTRIVRPIQEINEIAKDYGKGNYELRADEDYSGEVGELATSFNTMADKLSKSINDLTQERNRLEDIVNVSTEGIVLFDENGNITVTNDTIKTLFSRVPKKNLFTEKLQLIPFDEVWTNVDECIAENETKDFLIEGPDYAYHVTILPKTDPDDPDKCSGATGFVRDITEESKLERTRKDYVANISHELRTPLQTLRGLIEPLADGMVKNEEDRQRYYNIILNETLRLSRLIDDMLELSKLQSRTLAFKTYPFDINNLLSEFETKMLPVMKEAKIKFKVMFNTGKLPTVIGNPDRVEQILVILLDNAKKYTPAEGSITIHSEYNEMINKVMISVSDTGQGIHEYDINHIFDRFFKADRARGKKGTGLGLAIAKELLTYMGEDITVESEYGKGTTFTFTLKRAETNATWY